MNSKTAILLATIAAAGLPASGEFIIDNFSFGTAEVVLYPPPPGQPGISGPGYDGPAVAGILGGSRSVELTVEAPGLPGDPTDFSIKGQVRVVELAAPGFGDKGIVRISNDDLVNSKVVITWDNSLIGLGGVDITLEGPAILLDIVSTDQDITARFDIWDTSSGHSWLSKTTAVAGPQTIAFPLGLFTAGADFTDVDKITMLIDPPAAGDMSITKVYMVVPETSTVLGMGALAGLVGIWQVRRMRKA